MEAEDRLKGVEKKLMIAQCTDREKVLFTVHQLYGTAANWWETYCMCSLRVLPVDLHDPWTVPHVLSLGPSYPPVLKLSFCPYLHELAH
jgi:hypothetical protein